MKLILALAVLATLAPSRGLSCPDTPGWQAVKIGGGGYITGMDISPDGTTRCIRTDTYGAYCLEGSTWHQVVTSDSMPAAHVIPGNGHGAFELVIAPSLPTRLYMAWDGYVFRSDNRGSTWAQTGFTRVLMDANDSSVPTNEANRLAGEKMAVDPQNPDVVLLGTQWHGLWRTEDGGTTWAQIASVPDAPTPTDIEDPMAPIAGIAFATGETADGRTNVIWLGSEAIDSGDAGVYKSTDEGDTFTRITGGPAGDGVWHGAAEGSTYWVTSDNTANLYKLVGTTWTDCTNTTHVPQTLALDPTSDRLVATPESTQLSISDDNCTTWRQPSEGYFYNPSYTCPTVPWLCAQLAGEDVDIVQSDMAFDPIVANRLWAASGVGVWTADATSVLPNILWTERSAGLEQLVANTVIVPPNGLDVPITASWDFGTHRLATPATYQSAAIPGDAFSAAWHADYASSDPNFVVSFQCWDGPSHSAYSANGGATWTEFATMPVGADCNDTWGKGGTGAVADTNSWIWVPSNSRAPYYTNDAAATWTKLSLPSVNDDATEDGWGGLHWAFYLNRHIVAADRVTIGTYYIYHFVEGVFRSTDSGVTWTEVFNGPLQAFSGFNAKMQSVPGHAGHLFFTVGPQGSVPEATPANAPLMRSTDGGATWSSLSSVKEVFALGFGKVVAGYPTIYVIGWVNDVYGVWKSIDNAVSWTRLGGQYAMSSLDLASTIDGDKVGDRVFIGYRGSGYAYYNP